MKHPFAVKKELGKQQTQQVTGGLIVEVMPELSPESEVIREKQRPDVGSTMAIGEEGGYRFPIF